MTPAIPHLVRTRFSPWSERAAWALDHHRIDYRTIEHVPFIGERRLRRLVGPEKKRVSVPVLLAGDLRLTESWDIALHSDRVGAGPKLIPLDRMEEVRGWNDLADTVMAASRGLVVAALLASPAALDESLPANVPRLLRPLLRPVTRRGMSWFGKKYEVNLAETESRLPVIRAGLETLRSALSKTTPYLTGTFSYADIVMATCLQGVSPVDHRWIRLGPATRKAWTRDDLAAAYPDLIAWRDELYERHRK